LVVPLGNAAPACPGFCPGYPNSITNYIDGQAQNQFTDNVPADAAHGGMNELAGVGEQTWWSQDLQHGPNSLTLYNVQYAPPDTVIA
jgi:hypothetical protein